MGEIGLEVTRLPIGLTPNNGSGKRHNGRDVRRLFII
jgi:hypothetical protein